MHYLPVAVTQHWLWIFQWEIKHAKNWAILPIIFNIWNNYPLACFTQWLSGRASGLWKILLQQSWFSKCIAGWQKVIEAVAVVGVLINSLMSMSMAVVRSPEKLGTGHSRQYRLLHTAALLGFSALLLEFPYPPLDVLDLDVVEWQSLSITNDEHIDNIVCSNNES